MGERLLQPSEEIIHDARRLARDAEPGRDRDRLDWIAAGHKVGRSTLLALLAAGVDGRLATWALRMYGQTVDQERESAIRALTAAAVDDTDDRSRYFGITDGADTVHSVARVTGDTVDRWTARGWETVPDDRRPVGLPYRELAGDVLADALTATAAGQALMLRATSPRAYLPGKAPPTVVAAAESDGVYAAVDETDNTAVLAVTRLDRGRVSIRHGGRWLPDDDGGSLPYLLAAGAPLALVPERDTPQLLRGFDDHEYVFPVIAADMGTPAAAGLAVRAADTGRVLMLQRALTDDDPAAGDWEFPGGHLEPDENPYDGAAREWREETGMDLPDGEMTGTWTSPDGVYQGHVLTVPSEKDLDLYDGRDQWTNPDDPDGDEIEQIAWWDPDDLQDNPAVRDELTRDLPQVLPALDQGAPDEDEDEEDGAILGDDAVTAAGRRGTGRWRHGWIPIGGEPDLPGDGGDVEQVAERLHAGQDATIGPDKLPDLLGHLASGGLVDLSRLQVTGAGNEHLFRDSATDIPRAQMPQLPKSADELGHFADRLRAAGATGSIEDVDPRTLRATQSDIDGQSVGAIYRKILDGTLDPNTVVITSKDGDVLDGHHRWGGWAAAATQDPSITMKILRTSLSIDELLDLAREISLPPMKLGERRKKPLTSSAGVTFGMEPDTPPPDPDEPWLWTGTEWVKIAEDDDNGDQGGEDGPVTAAGQPDFSHSTMVALPVDQGVAQHLAVPDGLTPDDMHVTLVVLDDDADVDHDELARMVADWAAGQDHVSGELSGPATFEGGGDTPVQVALVDAARLPQMRASLADHLVASGVPISETHAYTPHITRTYSAEPAPDGIGGTPVEFDTVMVCRGGDCHHIPLGAPPVTASTDAGGGGGWDESKHPRQPTGEFAPKGTAPNQAQESARTAKVGHATPVKITVPKMVSKAGAKKGAAAKKTKARKAAAARRKTLRKRAADQERKWRADESNRHAAFLKAWKTEGAAEKARQAEAAARIAALPAKSRVEAHRAESNRHMKWTRSRQQKHLVETKRHTAATARIAANIAKLNARRDRQLAALHASAAPGELSELEAAFTPWETAIIADAAPPGQRYRHGWIPIGDIGLRDSKDSKWYSEHLLTGHGIDDLVPGAQVKLRQAKPGSGIPHKIDVTIRKPSPLSPDPSVPSKYDMHQQVASMLYDSDTGRVEGIHTEDPFKRRGVATKMWDVAKKLHEQHGLTGPKHSETQTSEGAAWAAKTAAVLADAVAHTRTPHQLQEYWVHGAGAAKIRWGEGNDWYRCVEQLSKYVHNPHMVKGQCNSLHKIATGMWPATHDKILHGGKT